MLTTPLDKYAFIILKARAWEAEIPEDPEEPESGSNPSDDDEAAALEGGDDNPALFELIAAIEELNDDELTELLALVWLGRGDYTNEEWDAALADADQAEEQRNAARLAELAGLGEFIEQGLSELGYSTLGENGTG